MKELFRAAVGAIDKYTKALEMSMPQDYIDGIDRKMTAFLKEIDNRGLTKEFEEFSLVG
jgi:hypothetical protein